MFKNCSSLVKAPSILPATTLQSWIYTGMFKNCSSLIDAPELPAETLEQSCYYQMFSGCKSLKSVTIPGTVTSIGNNTGNDVGFGTAAANSLLNGLSSLCRCKTSLKGIDSNNYLHIAKIQKEYDICNNNGIQTSQVVKRRKMKIRGDK